MKNERRRGKGDHSENLERWLITYADLITLLLAFFIMMYAISRGDHTKHSEISGHLRSIFLSGSGLLDGVAKDPLDSLRIELLREIEELNDRYGVGQISVAREERGIVIRILDRAFFDEGKADLTEDAKVALRALAPILKRIPNRIAIEGHTDNVPISNSEFKSNWDLSVRRAVEVVRYLIEKEGIPPKKLSASGYAEYRPVAPNSSPYGRALNRRIEITILTSSSF